MFDTILGLPVHSLVVHAVVVLVPLCAVGVVLMAASRTWRDRLRWPLVALLTFALGSTFVADKSGERLKARLAITGNPDLTRHVDLGSKAKYVVFAFWLLAVLWLVLEWLRDRAGTTGGQDVPGGPGLVRVLGVLAVVAAVGATGWVVWTGHAGSAAVWRGVVQATQNR